MAFQYLGVTRLPSCKFLLVKEISNATWNCGDNLHFDKISTKAIDLEWIGGIPKYIPGVILRLIKS